MHDIKTQACLSMSCEGNLFNEKKTLGARLALPYTLSQNMIKCKR